VIKQQIPHSLYRGTAMRAWQLQEARSRFSELVSAALARGPQRVTRHGKAAVIVVSDADWEEVTQKDSVVRPVARPMPARSGGSRRAAAGTGAAGRGWPMSYVVDTDVLSTTWPTSPRAIPGLPAWLESNSEQLHLSVVSLIEISYGIAWLRHRQAPRKAALLQAWLDDVTTFHQSRIIKVVDDIALRAGQLLAKARAGGVEVSAEDALIAATADVNDMTVLSVNARHFAPMGVRHVDPRAGLPPEAGS
jgi:prevent-host-death family protein